MKLATHFVMSMSLVVSSLVFAAPSNAATTDCTVSSSTKCTVTFSYTGALENWTVPTGITEIYFDVRGAQGGGANGGQGGIDTGTITVASGSNLIIRVGGQGTLGLTASGGFNGGGSTNAGDTAPGSGGGASDIRLNTDTLASRIVVAGGGGGQSTYCGIISKPTQNVGGAGGGATGGDGGSGATGCWAGSFGGGGTQLAGGIKGGDASYANTIGSLGVGGNGRGYSAGGGGGGGGYYGGGGAAVGAGGGGSSYVNPTYVTNFVLTRGGRTGNGIVTLTYANFQSSSVSLSSNNGSEAIFRTTTLLTATSPQNGRVTFTANGKAIPGCVNRLLVSTATCSWKPSFRGAILIGVRHSPSGAFFASSNSLNMNVVRRTSPR